MPHPRALYNEIDPYAAAWLRNLISRGLIADGDVAECSIADLRPSDLRGYCQVHFFAGIGVWSYGARRAGIPDDRPFWSASCPCQPFSDAGKGAGFDDERHLWPHLHWLIEQCRPDVVVGEQVASKDGLGWLDLVQADLEGSDYTSAAVDMCSAGFGAPHIRQRLYWMGVADSSGPQSRRQGCTSVGQRGSFDATSGISRLADALRSGAGSDTGTGIGTQGTLVTGDGDTSRPGAAVGDFGASSIVADASTVGLSTRTRNESIRLGARQSERPNSAGTLDQPAGSGCEWFRTEPEHEQLVQAVAIAGRLADAVVQQRPDWQPGIGAEHHATRRDEGAAAASGFCDDLRPGPTNGFWRDADWLLCRDGKWRPVEPGTFPLAHGAASRVGRLRAYGNAINAEQATEFCRAVADVI